MGRGANFQNDIGLRWLGHQNTGSRRIVGPCLGGVFLARRIIGMRVTRNADSVS